MQFEKYDSVLNTIIIGAGQVAGGYDAPGDESILTHAHGYKSHRGFNLLGFYDVDYTKALEMATKWGVPAFKTLDEIKNADVVSICTPDEFHLQSVEQALKLMPKLIFLEKPLSNNVKDAQELVKISKTTQVLVNFSRRFVREFQDLADEIQQGKFGDFQTGSGFYGKGFIHNGSHMLDLLKMFFGKIEKIQIIDSFVDFYSNDPTKTAQITLQNDKKFLMQGVNCNLVTVFELDLFFEFKRIKIIDSGKKILFFNINEFQNGYKFFKYEKETKTELDFAMKNAIENIYSHLKCNEPLKLSAFQAFEVTNYG